MTILASILLLALTRAELIERFHAPVIKQVSGLVEVYADCPKEMRRAYQLPIARFASETCTLLYGSLRIRPIVFQEPGIVIHIGDVKTNDTRTVVAIAKRDNGSTVTRLTVPAPEYVDREGLRLAIARAFMRAVKNEERTDAQVARLLRDADPRLRAAGLREDLRAWREKGVYTEGRTDDDYLKLQRTVLEPGCVAPADALVFASRLMLYPVYFDMPFCGRYHELTFAEAVPLRNVDPTIRLVAAYRAQEIPILAGGRGPALAAAAAAYADFLIELAKSELTDEELLCKLATADGLLKGAIQ